MIKTFRLKQIWAIDQAHLQLHFLSIDRKSVCSAEKKIRNCLTLIQSERTLFCLPIFYGLVSLE